MGRVGAAGDNAAMESFFALLQKNLLNQRSWTTRDQQQFEQSEFARGVLAGLCI
jgi:transposase InsO family protein